MKKRIWLITGCSSGLGKAIADAALESEDFVIGTFRNQAQVDAFNAQNNDKGLAVKLDITNTSEIEKTIKYIESEFRRIDVLVNNAGFGFIGAIEETSIDEVRSVFEANFFGTLQLTQAVLPLMRKARHGQIIQISSHGGLKAFAGFGIYNASKFALEGFSESLVQEVSPLGIKVLIVQPGPFRTQFANKGLGEAKMRIKDYDATAGIFREKLKSVDGKQEGDPVKAARVILDTIDTDYSILRLQLGTTALKTISMKLESVASDLKANEALAKSVVY